MARTGTKKQSKAPLQTSTTQTTSTPTSASSIPKPFVLAPIQLRSLVSTLPTDHVYTVHLDTNPVVLKKRVYVVPVILNLIITIGLAARLYYAAPIYLDQLITIFGYETAWKVKPETMGYTDIISEISGRTGLLMMDYAIFAFIGSWPWEFLFGSKYSRHTGPLSWRTDVGFQETEVVVRKGRKWDTALFTPEDKTWTREDELSILVKVEAALARNYTNKTGYQLLDKDWDLDFKGMIDAHQLLGKGKLALKDIDHIALVYYQKQWLLWQVHESSGGGASTSEDDAGIRSFREKMQSLGYEDIFFRWVEIVQYETSLPIGFTRAKKSAALQEIQKMLAERKVSYEKFLEDIGGEKELPGMSSS